jgi:hypothetical protein
MDAKTTAPTITINDVTSRPGEPVTMVALDCGAHPITSGHVIEIGDSFLCRDEVHADTDPIFCTVTSVFKTWMF